MGAALIVGGLVIVASVVVAGVLLARRNMRAARGRSTNVASTPGSIVWLFFLMIGVGLAAAVVYTFWVVSDLLSTAIALACPPVLSTPEHGEGAYVLEPLDPRLTVG